MNRPNLLNAHQMIARVRNLPPISAAALELTRQLGRAEANQEDILRALKQDSVLTARLLRACNSPALALRMPVTSVDHAVLMLGHKELFQMVLALAARGPLSIPLGAYAMQNEDLWRHSLLSATAAEMAVSDGLQVGMDSSTAFTVGLLHDIGKLITNQFFSRECMVAMRQLIVEGFSPTQAEKEVLGADHAEVGAGLLYIWRLPEPIIEAVARHHEPVLRPEPRASALASFASHMAHHAASLPALGQTQPREHEREVLEALGFGPERFPAFVERIQSVSADTNEVMLVA